jgi:hypothetical protein
MDLGWGTVAGLIARIINNFIPSKKAALYDELKALEVKYKEALDARKDTEAATIKKQMKELRKKLGIVGEDVYE